MKKRLIAIASFTLIASAFADNQSIPSPFRGCWQSGTMKEERTRYEISSNHIEWRYEVEAISLYDKAISVSPTDKNAVEIKTKPGLDAEDAENVETSHYHFTLLNAHTLQAYSSYFDETQIYKKVKCEK